MKQKLQALGAALMLCATPLFAEDFVVDGIYYNITPAEDKTVAVTYRGSYYDSYSNEYSGTVTIPDSVTYNDNTYSVTSIGDKAFYDCDGLTSVVIPNSVTSIGSYAFYECSNLTSVEIPNSVTSIGFAAFFYCPNLTSVVIPNSVTSIESSAFRECSSLTSVVIPNSVTSIGDDAFYGCSSLTTVTVGCSWKENPLYDFGADVTVNATLHSYENGACTGCEENSPKFDVDRIYYYIISSTDKTVAVTYQGDYPEIDSFSGAITIPESVTYSGSTYSVTSIGDEAFSNCYGLTSVEIPNSVTSIGNYAFSWCSSLTSFEIPDSVTSIGNYAFFNCSNLTSVEIPNSVTSIGDYAFYYCEGLTSVVIPNSVTSIGSSAFYNCSNLTSVVIPNSVTSIGSEAFKSCPSLTSIAVAEGNPAYDSRNNCNAIIETQTNTLIAGCSETTIPNSVTSIGSEAFYDCDGLTSVEIPNSVTSIGYNAFISCSSLTSVVIPNSVTNIGSSAFRECSSLTSVVIPNSVTSIEEDAFYKCSSLTTATVGCSWKTNPLYDFGANVTVNTTPHSYENGACTGCEENSPKFDVDGIYYYIISSTDKTVAVTYLGDSPDNTFYSDAVTIPESVTYSGSTYSVTSIGDEAFSWCDGLTSVEIGNSVTSIGNFAFSYCLGLTSVEISNSVTSIGDYAFEGCSSLTSMEIPNSVTSIGGGAFSDCSSLTSVVIPDSVTSIGSSAFEYCSNLTSVVIPNSVTSIGNSAFANCSALTTATVGCSWKTNPLYDFGGDVTVNATLHSYEKGVCTVCGEGEFVEIELVEGTPFENDETREVAKVTYNRTLPNLKWNALYLPVEIPVAELSENYDVAYFNNMHAYDRNDDGTIDEMDMEIFLIKEGTLHANHPYFIRAKSEAAKQLTLELTDVTLYSTDSASCTSITAASAYMNFELIGVYERYEAEELTGCYAINTSGAWSPIALGSYLNPFRFYLKMTSRNSSPVKVDEALKSIRIRVHGEDGTTGIDNMTINCPQTPAIYDLQGRRVSNPGRGMYIVNGKKVMIQ